jgi:hypothetical protein
VEARTVWGIAVRYWIPRDLPQRHRGDTGLGRWAGLVDVISIMTYVCFEGFFAFT